MDDDEIHEKKMMKFEKTYPDMTHYIFIIVLHY